MKRYLYFTPILIILLITGLAANIFPAQAAGTFQDAPTPTPTTEPKTSDPSARPVIVIESYYQDTDDLTPGKDFSVAFTLKNTGQHNAINILVNFTPGDIIPSGTGGTLSMVQLIPDEKKGLRQPMTVSPSAAPNSVTNITVTISYADQSTGASYSDTFNMAFRVTTVTYSGPILPTRTPTPVIIERPQLVINRYTTDVDPLQPGSPFSLNIDIRNLGNMDAKSVVMVLGGGVSPDVSTTPQPGGISGASGEFTNFAPLGSSNIQYLGDLPMDQTISTQQKLIVNTTTNPGAYSVKFSLVYTDEKGARYVDEQVITLLVYRLPLVDISFYSQVDPLFVGQPGQLPIQIVNLSRSAVILGSMKASAEGADLTNNVTLVGPLDPGGYFPLDATIIPSQPGPLDITIEVNYTDDFNQPQTITKTLQIDVQDAPVDMGPTSGDGSVVNPGEIGVDQPGQTEQTFWQKVVRFIKGLVGLDSGEPQIVQPDIPQGEKPLDGGSEVIPQPVPQKGP